VAAAATADPAEPGRAKLGGQDQTGETGVMDEAVRRYRDEMDSQHTRGPCCLRSVSPAARGSTTRCKEAME